MAEYLYRHYSRSPKVEQAHPDLGYSRPLPYDGSLIPLKDDTKWSKYLAKILVSNICYLDGLPTDIVLDWDRPFDAFWADI
jgi:hypothetical protein